MIPSDKSLLNTINTGFTSNTILQKLFIPTLTIDLSNTLIKTGFDKDTNTVVLEYIPNVSVDDVTFEESIKGSVKTGFGDGTLIAECSAPNLVLHLSKDNYLSEFESATEKQLARNNLQVYSITEVDNIVNNLVLDSVNKYLTKTDVANIIAGLDFVDSTLKSYVDYQIPESLFTL